MKKLKAGLVMASLAASVAGNALAQEDMRRFKLKPFSQMTPTRRGYCRAHPDAPGERSGAG